jgi:inner membrane protein
MDSITHLALGAVIGEGLFGKSLGKKAMVLGAAVQFCPDSDVAASLWLSTADNLLAHRGFTHSFLFVALASGAFALLADRWHRRQSIYFKSWILFFSLQMSVHIFLDAFNAYGVGWFEPFNNLRISFNTIFVADPFFSIWIGIACFALLLMNHKNPQRIRWVLFSLLMSSAYLMYCTYNKLTIDRDVKKIFQSQHISYNRYFTTPTPFNNWLWYVVAEDGGGYYIGYRSVFDKQLSMQFEYFTKQDNLLEQVDDHESLQRLRRFSQGYYTIENRDGKLIFNDLRFGQSAGWHNPKAPFVFNYYLQHPEENLMAIQRGRMEGWNSETFNSLIERIKGN